MSTADRAIARALDRIHTEEAANTRPYIPGSYAQDVQSELDDLSRRVLRLENILVRVMRDVLDSEDCMTEFDTRPEQLI